MCTEAATSGVPVKKVFLEISQNSQENPFYQRLFFNNQKKSIWHRCFPVNFTKFLRTSFYITPSDNCFCSYTIIFDQRTFFSIIKLVFRGKLEFYLFYYNPIFKDRVLFKQIRSSIEIGVTVVKKHTVKSRI